MLREITDKVVGDTLGRVAAGVARDIEGGSSAPRIDPSDVQKLKLAQKRADQINSTGPLKSNDTSLAGVISRAVQGSKVPDFSTNTQSAQGGNSMSEADEGKMGYPTNVPPKRDRDPRHPANRNVSAKPGFVGG